MFGLTNSEGNHGEDVKELWYFQDGTPTHSYMRMLYKYPQAEFPYARLVAENRARTPAANRNSRSTIPACSMSGRYFDVTVEYAKASPEDTLMRVTVVNRGPDEATLHLLPQLWARNMWSWTHRNSACPHPPPLGSFRRDRASACFRGCRLFADGTPELLFCENETNHRRLSGLAVKRLFQGRHQRLHRSRRQGCRQPRTAEGSKCAFHYQLDCRGRRQRQRPASSATRRHAMAIRSPISIAFSPTG